jgi:hypothetical protein
MARTPLSGPAAPLRADDVRWLVDFARRSGIDALGFEEAALLCRHVVSITLTGRWDGAVHLLQEEAGFTPRELIGWVPSSLRLADNRGHEARVAWLTARQQDAAGPLSALEASAPYTLEAIAMVLAPTPDGAATLRYAGSLDEAFACIVVHAFAAHARAFRACGSPKCRRLFLPADGRQKYCSTACGQSVRWARFVTNTRKPKATRGRAKSGK